MSTFQGVRAKVARAVEQTNLLESQLERFIDEQPYTIEQVPNPKTSRKALIFRPTKALPLEWPVVVGEILHDLRSALDHAVYELTVAEQGHAFDKTEFPVFEDEPKFFETNKKGDPVQGSGLYKIRGVSSAAHRVIVDMQPFEIRKTAGPNEHPILATVHNLNIIDKHRALALARTLIAEMEVTALRKVEGPFTLYNAPSRTLKDGTVLVEWTAIDPLDGEVDVEVSQLLFGIGWDEEIPTLDKRFLIPTLRMFIVGVTNVLMLLEETL
ncbi:MAG: hypothetical protein LC750_08580 [Actinobacteria bacterium]|nr:hypothetical protein [Actinomycetota bacterium]